MTELDYWTLRIEFLSAAVEIIALFFTMVTIYITGLYFYLARASLRLRVLGFSVFTIGWAWTGMLGLNMRQISQEALYCATCMPEKLNDAPLKGWVPDGAVAGVALGLVIYFALVAMTFSTGWRAETFPQSVK